MQFHVTEAQEQDISILWSNDAKKGKKKAAEEFLQRMWREKQK
jgi:hypothetical protein